MNSQIQKLSVIQRDDEGTQEDQELVSGSLENCVEMLRTKQARVSFARDDLRMSRQSRINDLAKHNSTRYTNADLTYPDDENLSEFSKTLQSGEKGCKVTNASLKQGSATAWRDSEMEIPAEQSEFTEEITQFHNNQFRSGVNSNTKTDSNSLQNSLKMKPEKLVVMERTETEASESLRSP